MTDTSTNDDLTREQLLSRISALEEQVTAVSQERDDLRAELLLEQGLTQCMARHAQLSVDYARVAIGDRAEMHRYAKDVMARMERKSKPTGFYDFLLELFGRRQAQ